jgi:hypothetical protein
MNNDDRQHQRLRNHGSQENLRRLYWTMRIGIAFIWIWTAITSWFLYPHAISLEWLRTLGLTYQTERLFAAACLLDLGLGMASLFYVSRRLWQMQFALVVIYSLAVAIWLPVYLVHPFGAVSKNVAVLACLLYLVVMEDVKP